MCSEACVWRSAWGSQSQGWNSSCPALWQAPLPTERPHQLKLVSFRTMCVFAHTHISCVHIETRGQAQVLFLGTYPPVCSSKFLLLFYYVCGCSAYMRMPSDCRGQKQILGALGLEFQMIVGCHVGTGNRTKVLWKNSQFS